MLIFKEPPYPAARPERLGFLLYLSAGFAGGMVVPFFPLWAHDEAGIAVGLIGLLFGCYAAGELIATPFIGGIADRIGRRPVLILSSSGVGLGFIALYFTHGAFEAAIVLICTGISESVLHPTISTVIADVTEEETHRHQFSVARVSSSIGRVAGPALGAFLAWLSLGSVFLAAGVASLAGGLIMLLCLPETRTAEAQEEEDDEEEEESLAALLPAFRDRRLAALLAWFMLIEIAGSWIEAVLPLQAHRTGALSSSGVGMLFAYAAAIMAVAQLPLTAILKKQSSMFLVLGAGGALIAAFALLIASHVFLALIGAVTLYALSDMLTGPLVPTVVNQLAPPKRRATYMAATSVASDLRYSIGPATGTALYAASSVLPWVIGIPFAGLAAIGLGATILRHERPSKSPSEGTPSTPAADVVKPSEPVRIIGLR